MEILKEVMGMDGNEDKDVNDHDDNNVDEEGKDEVES